MNPLLQHSHVAVYGNLRALVKAANTRLQFDEDDLGPYSFFELTVRDKIGSEQRVRFASHEGDSMVHLLVERIDEVDGLVRALANVGITQASKLSISTDPRGNPLRNIEDIRVRLLAVGKE